MNRPLDRTNQRIDDIYRVTRNHIYQIHAGNNWKRTP